MDTKDINPLINYNGLGFESIRLTSGFIPKEFFYHSKTVLRTILVGL